MGSTRVVGLSRHWLKIGQATLCCAILFKRLGGLSFSPSQTGKWQRPCVFCCISLPLDPEDPKVASNTNNPLSGKHMRRGRYHLWTQVIFRYCNYVTDHKLAFCTYPDGTTAVAGSTKWPTKGKGTSADVPSPPYQTDGRENPKPQRRRSTFRGRLSADYCNSANKLTAVSH